MPTSKLHWPFLVRVVSLPCEPLGLRILANNRLSSLKEASYQSRSCHPSLGEFCELNFGAVSKPTKDLFISAGITTCMLVCPIVVPRPNRQPLRLDSM